MWEPQPLTTLWAFIACYRDSFTWRYIPEDRTLQIKLTSVIKENGNQQKWVAS
jgi:hypothetical protein